MAQDRVFDDYKSLFTEPLRYVAPYTQDSIIVDGRADDSSWSNAEWSESFVDIEGDARPKPEYRTRMKMMWSDAYLYVFAELDEPHVWGKIRERDEVVFHDNDFEIFMDPDNDSQQYFEIEVNALNTIFDLFLPRPYRDGGSALIPWNTPGLRSAVFIDGTINNPSDVDKNWSVEIAIPFKSVTLGNHVRIPKHGDFWRINFSRVQWDSEVIGNDYHRKKDESGKVMPEHNWVWSPQGIVNMHYPERWGYLFFSKSGSTAGSFSIPSDHHIRNALWLSYYKQQASFRKQRKYGSLSEIKNAEKIQIGGKTFLPECQCSNERFLFTLREQGTDTAWSIDEKGIIRTLKDTK